MALGAVRFRAGSFSGGELEEDVTRVLRAEPPPLGPHPVAPGGGGERAGRYTTSLPPIDRPGR